MKTEAPLQTRSAGPVPPTRAESKLPSHGAFSGVKIGLRSHSGFAVHIFTAALLIVGAVSLDCSVLEVAVLLGGIGVLFAAELFFGVIARVVQYSETIPNFERERCVSMAAGAVLIIRLTLVLVAVMIFVHRVAENLYTRY